MADLDLTRRRLQVKVGTETYKVLFPTARQVEQFDSKYKPVQKDQNKSLELIFDFLEALGMPKKVSEELDVENLTILLETLSGKKKEKS